MLGFTQLYLWWNKWKEVRNVEGTLAGRHQCLGLPRQHREKQPREKPKEIPGTNSEAELSGSSPYFCILMCAKGHTCFSRQHKVAALRSRTGSQCILDIV